MRVICVMFELCFLVEALIQFYFHYNEIDHMVKHECKLIFLIIIDIAYKLHIMLYCFNSFESGLINDLLINDVAKIYSIKCI
jgi:hypothetical protein